MKIYATIAAATALIAFSAPAFASCGSKNASHKNYKEMTKADIVDTAIAAGSFKTLVAAVQAAGLEETLRGPGPFTVFAPTDEAFAALPAGTVETLLKPENKDKLVSILTYHVVAGKTKSKQLAGKMIDTTAVSGGVLKINGTKGVMVNAAKVVKADIYTSNGVIHVIDQVLLPPAK